MTGTDNIPIQAKFTDQTAIDWAILLLVNIILQIIFKYCIFIPSEAYFDWILSKYAFLQ